MQKMYIIKRNGTKELLSLDKILKRIQRKCSGLSKDLNPNKIAIETINFVIDGISTKMLDELASKVAASYTSEDPDYSILASRIAISSMHKSVPLDFVTVTNNLYNDNLLNESYYKKALDYTSIINELYEKYEKYDYDFDYFGWKTLEKSYLLKAFGLDSDGLFKLYERPIHMYTRVALTVTKTEEEFKGYFKYLVTHYISPASPIMYNSGLKQQQLSSCVLIANQGDSFDGLNETMYQTGKHSKDAAGIGISIHDVRAKGSKISTTNGESGGIIPMVKSLNEYAKWWNQQGRRNGAFAIYLEPWHKDFEFLLNIRLPHGAEEFRARELFPAVWMCDEFMERVENDDVWYMFCPNEMLKLGLKPLWNIYGTEFKKEYNKAIEHHLNGKLDGKSIKARSIWQNIITSQMETGTPFLLYKDSINEKSNHKNIGVIRSSNLCCEIVQYTGKDEIATCNLHSIALPKFVKKVGRGVKFDFDKLGDVVRIITTALNNVLDITVNSSSMSDNGTKNQRAIGIGVQGLADTFNLMDMPFDSNSAKKLNYQIFECMYYNSLFQSNIESKKHGSYPKFKDSPISNGILQYDLWNKTESVETNSTFNWKELKDSIKKFGVRNSLLIAPMPTASSAQILGNNECFEPFTSNIYKRRVQSGDFTMINKHLVSDFKKYNIWNDSVIDHLIHNQGSIQTLDLVELLNKFSNNQSIDVYNVSTHLKSKYKTVWEISMKTIIDMAADRGVFIDQSQSMNLFVKDPNIGKISSMHMYSWKSGLKTGMYYLRSNSAKTANVNLARTKKDNIDPNEIIACSLDNPDACDACGS